MKLFGSAATVNVEQELIAAGIEVKEPSGGRGWRCGHCSKFKEGKSAWIEDSICIGDPLWSVIDRHKARAWNGHFTGWCLECAAKLLENKSPRVGPPPEPPSFTIPEYVELRRDRLTITLGQEGGGFLRYAPTDEGGKLLGRFSDYFNLAICGRDSYDSKEATQKALALIILDTHPGRIDVRIADADENQ